MVVKLDDNILLVCCYLEIQKLGQWARLSSGLSSVVIAPPPVYN